MDGTKASLSRRARARQRQRHRQRQRQTTVKDRTAARTFLAGVSLRPRPLTTASGRRKGSRRYNRWRMKPGRRPGGGRERSRSRPPATALLADDATVGHPDDVTGQRSNQSQTETIKSCKQINCAEGRGTCVYEQNLGARCRCQLGAVGNLCERGTALVSDLKCSLRLRFTSSFFAELRISSVIYFWLKKVQTIQVNSLL